MPSTKPYQIFYYRVDGSPPELAKYPEAASQTYKQNDLVYLVNGSVTKCATAGSTITTSGNLPWGIATMDATGTTGADAIVERIDGQTRFLAAVDHATAASAVTALAQIGATYVITTFASGHGGGFFVQIDNTTNPIFEVLEIPGEYSTTTRGDGPYAIGEQWGTVEGMLIATGRGLPY